jgi:hypothetical protein
MGINTRRCEAGIAALRCYRISNDRARVTRERDHGASEDWPATSATAGLSLHRQRARPHTRQ